MTIGLGPGDRVRHPRHGEGTVLKLRAGGRVRVRFDVFPVLPRTVLILDLSVGDGREREPQPKAAASTRPGTGITEDRFRIRIKDGMTVLYDNNIPCGDLDDNAIPCTDLTGGNIVIHNKGNKRGDETAPATVAEALPTVFALEQNYPNPFNPATRIAFELPASHRVKLVVFDVLGRQIETLVDRAMEAGRHEIAWQADNLPTGMYFYRITAGDFVQVRQMMLLK